MIETSAAQSGSPPAARTKHHFDVAIIGAGAAGCAAAAAAAAEGARVVLIGKPCQYDARLLSNAILNALSASYRARTANRFDGIRVEPEVLDWFVLVSENAKLVRSMLDSRYHALAQLSPRIAHLQGKASFADDGSLRVNNVSISAEHTIIASGARPAKVDIRGIDRVPVLTSRTACDLKSLPSSILIIGAGSVGSEYAQIFARAGVKVTLIGRRGLLPDAEPEISASLIRSFSLEGIRVVSSVNYKLIEYSDGQVCLYFSGMDGADVIRAESVLVATGRSANVDGLALAKVGVHLDERGCVAVDSQMRTSNSNIYAIGDVSNVESCAKDAAYCAMIAVKNACCNADLHYDHRVLPLVVFTDPQLASVGLTQAEAREAGHDVLTSIFLLESLSKAKVSRDYRGVIKLVVSAGDNRLLGAHVLASEAGEGIQTAALAIKSGMTCQELGDVIFPHLTVVEGLKHAAQRFGEGMQERAPVGSLYGRH